MGSRPSFDVTQDKRWVAATLDPAYVWQSINPQNCSEMFGRPDLLRPT